ncbi:hypothetical protein LAZ67_14002513 [Cordylochernes scorpioides]|uniref:Metalloendopeptidase n=1 Tax=Cordylochernes scorpioides TaxID=51811 RepID=A0ABY6L7V6_9ARAC|nr:hypothetical protein LAZ67_14002513 [Cordylochernes scorpioides]
MLFRCYSPIGHVYQGGVNKVSIGPGCEILPIVIHELGHSLGFFHEQNRSDRDDYLDIHWDNMQECKSIVYKPLRTIVNLNVGIQVAFFKHRPGDDRILTPFDHDSIMLYGELTGSKDGISKTLTAKNGHYLKESYMKSGLSPLDIEKVNKLYGCR